jgi:hypothetical protein
MNAMWWLLLVWLQAASGDPFLVRAELQGLYDEISQASLQFETNVDVDDFHAALYTPDWTFVDPNRRRRCWKIRTQGPAARSLG